MCDEYHCALTASPSMPITTTNHDDYEAYDDNKESIDVPSELSPIKKKILKIRAKFAFSAFSNSGD